MKLAFTAKQAGLHGVKRMCTLLDVSRSGFYVWQDRETSKRAREDGRQKVLIRSIFKRSRGTYEAPPILGELVPKGEHVSRKRVRRLMAEEGLEGRSQRRRKPRTTRAQPGLVGENRPDRAFTVSAPSERHDNAPMESFFGNLEDDLDIHHGRVFASPEHARTIIGEDIERFDNRARRRSTKQLPQPC